MIGFRKAFIGQQSPQSQQGPAVAFAGRSRFDSQHNRSLLARQSFETVEQHDLPIRFRESRHRFSDALGEFLLGKLRERGRALRQNRISQSLGGFLRQGNFSPDGSPAIVLLQVNDWDFNWQQVWQLTSPGALPAQTRLEMEFVYDNSAANPQNPFHPPRAVRDGHNTTDEMAQVFLHVSPRDPADLAALEAAYQRKLLERMRHDQARRIEAQRARQSETRPTTPANASPRPER